MKHDDVLEELIKRLMKKPGFISVKEYYYGPKGTLHGEMDVHWYRKINGTWVHRYYEVKTRHSEAAYHRAHKQFLRHKQYHEGEEYKYILVTSDTVQRIRL